MTACFRKLAQRDLLADTDYFVFHCTSVYLCRRAFQRLAQNVDSRLSLQEIQDLYATKVEPSTLLTQVIGTMYTASCYASLYSLISTQRDQLLGKRLGVFSFGSGAIGSLFRLRVARLPGFALETQQQLDARILQTPEEFVRRSQAYSETYGRFGFVPSRSEGQQADAYYLDRVEDNGQRHYRLGPLLAKNRAEPPPLPVPRLEHTVAQLQALARGLLSEAERERLGAACQSLLEGEGPRLPRERWATVRASLALVPSNALAFELIETALCVLCLDEGALPDPGSRLGYLMASSLHNRWYDKSLQLAVMADGNVGALMEHSGFDAAQLSRVLREIIAAAQSASVSSSERTGAVPSALPLALSSDAESALGEAQAVAEQISKGFTFRQLFRRSPTRAQLLASGVHPDVYVQLALQLAYFRLRGSHAIAYQPVQTRHFKLGRTEALRPATAEMLEATRAFERGEPRAKLREAFRNATDAMLSQQQRCLVGDGVDRHLLALRSLAEERGLRLALFAEPELDRVVGPAPLCTSTSEVAPGFGEPMAAFFPETEGGFGVAYLVQDKGLTLMTSSSPSDAASFQAALARAFDQLDACLLADAKSELAMPAHLSP